MTAPQTSESTLPLPQAPAATRPAPAPVRPGKGWAWAAESVLAALVLAFAFLAASFAARNADFWLHLATGRLIAQGRYQFGVDPFAYTTAGVYWVNHAWLSDRALFFLYTTVGDVWLVVFKAVLIAALAGVLLLIRRPGRTGWAPAFCTALAVLAMSPRLLLEPGCVSLAFLGLTLWLLWRARTAAPRLRLFGRAIDPRVWLLPLFALWVNLDDWFLLGPALVALFWLGDRLRPVAARPTPTWLLPACLAACLCSPYHIFAFTLPADLYPLPFTGGLLHDIRFGRLSASPWQFDAGFRSPAGANIAGLAYFALVLLGAASFALDRTALRDWRGLAWGAFALLAAWQVRLIPFFAVVAGPVTALNLQGTRLRLPAAVAAAPKAACLGALLALVALAVPGWLLGFNQTARQVAWGVEVNPSLRRAAETLYDWRTHGLLTDNEHTFAFHPDAACYLAWFCPEEKSFLDDRLNLFSRTADDYTDVCRELDPALLPPGVKLPSEDRSETPASFRIFPQRHVAVVLLYDPDPARVLAVMDRLHADPDQWTLLSVDGQALLFGWNPARAGGDKEPFAALRFDPVRVAFGPARAEAPPAPAAGPPREPRPPDWTTHFGRPPAPAWESAAANAYLRLFDDEQRSPGRREAVDRFYLTAACGGAALAGLPAYCAPPGGAPACATPLAFGLTALHENLPNLSDEPPELPLLAVRAARRAVAADPDDANAYLRLAQAYLVLRDRTAEHTRGAALAPLAMLRHVQAAAALRHALTLNPDLEVAHQQLAALFLERGCYDAALDHLRDEVRLTRRGPAEDADAYKRRLDGLRADLKALERTVQDAQDQYAIRAHPLGDDPLAKAELALQLGLSQQALEDVLLQSRVELFGSAGAKRELELLLLLGRAREARDMLADPDMKANKHKLTTYEIRPPGPAGRRAVYVFPAYEWLLTCAEAALGDYDAADAALSAIGDRLAGEGQADRKVYDESIPTLIVFEVGAQAQPRPGPLPLLWSTNRELQDRLASLRAVRADVLTLRGVLDLERGSAADGRRRLEEAAALAQPGDGPRADAPGAPLNGAYLKRVRAAGE